MHQVKSRVLKNEAVVRSYFRLTLECPEVAERAVPGQFVMLRGGKSYDPLLRRPFSIHRINKGQGIEILYKVIGKGTEMMAHIKPEDEVGLIGPLGRGFTFEPALKEAIIVGGGIGTAPMLALLDALKQSWEKRNVVVFLGGRSRDDILCTDEFRELGADLQIATDDGSSGHKGLVTELLEEYLGLPHGAAPTSNLSLVYSCGPQLMSKRIAEICKKNNIPCQVSLEAHMACGVGACLGCVIKTKGTVLTLPNPLFDKEGVPKAEALSSCGCDSNFVSCDTQLPETSYKRVCMEGPVFDAEEVIWD